MVAKYKKEVKDKDYDDIVEMINSTFNYDNNDRANIAKLSSLYILKIYLVQFLQKRRIFLKIPFFFTWRANLVTDHFQFCSNQLMLNMLILVKTKNKNIFHI